MMFGSAFKGANGQKESFCDIRRYLANHRSYVDLYKKENQVFASHLLENHQKISKINSKLKWK